MKFKSLFILLLITTQSYSQSNKFQMGLSLGAGLTELRGATSQENPLIGHSMGLQFQYNFSELFSIHSSILFETKGIELSNDWQQCTNCPNNGALIQLEYITVPLLARLNFGSKSKLFINAGPYFGYLINNDWWVDNRFDFGLTTGLGGQINLNKNLILSLEIRNNLGFVPLSTINPDLLNDRYNNSIIGIMGIAYRLGNVQTKE